MADALYPSFKKLLLDGDIDLLSDTIKAILIDTDDEAYNAADDNLDDITAAGRVAVSGALDGKSTTGGVFDANDVTFSSVTGDPCEAIILYKEGAGESTSPLIAFLDTFASGMPVTPNGGNITVAWSSGASKIFAL